MIEKTRQLPDFDNPPVIEIALSIQFDALAGLRTYHFGLLWAKYKERFPKVEEYPPISPVVETFKPQVSSNVSVRLELMESPPMSRWGFVSEKGDEVIQIQRDRFVHNWRKADNSVEYPHYDHIRETFRRELRVFYEFLSHEGIGEPTINQCEVAYINHLVEGEGWRHHSQMCDVLTLLKSQEDASPLEPEDVRFAARYVIRSEADGKELLGRLHIGVEPAYRATDEKAVFIMPLVARGKPEGEGIEGALKFLDRGHELIVKGFTYVTSEQMHKIWRRRL